MQKDLEQAHREGRLDLERYAQTMVKRLRMNFDVQNIWPRGKYGGGPYKDYHLVNRFRNGKYKSTGDAFDERNLYAKVTNGASGNTVAIDYFFRYYLLFVDWGVGKGQKKEQVPRKGGDVTMKRLYAPWRKMGDRQRRPVVMGTLRSSRFYLGHILQKYWQKEVQTVVLAGLGEMDAQGNYTEIVGGVQGL